VKRRETPPGVRAALIERFRGRADRHPYLPAHVHRERLAALEAGLPVELSGWELYGLLPDAPRVSLVRLEADDTVTVMRLSPVRGGATTPVRGGAA